MDVAVHYFSEMKNIILMYVNKIPVMGARHADITEQSFLKNKLILKIFCV